MDYQVCEPLYSANKDSRTKVTVNQGGTSSGKTYTIEQLLLEIALMDAGCVITIVGQDVPNLKKGAIRDMAKIISSSPYIQKQLYDYANTKGYNKTDRIYEFRNGSIIEFNSYENEQDARGGRRDYLYINECNGVPYEVYWQLKIRTRKRVFLDYNPSARFWCHEKVIGQADSTLIISDHRHNSFLTQELHDEIENIPDKELWRVYARGLTGQIHGLIYPKYRIVDEIPGLFPFCYGLDFGYNHKTALVQVSFDTKRLFWDEQIYQTELTIGDLIQQMKELKIGKTKIYADHAAPDKIVDLQRAGFNVSKANKDVKNGLDFVKRNGLYVTKRSKGLISEIGSYKYKIQEINGSSVTLDEPVKFKDDGMDAGRYGSYTGWRLNNGIIVSEDMDYDMLDAA